VKARTTDREDGFATLPDGGKIAYQICGPRHGGVPVLLICPLGGSMALWGTFRDILSEGLRVISFDLRGTGDSSPDPAWVSTRSLARDGLQVLAQLGVVRAHVFGISLGGMTATWLAILAPARVAKLCLASAPARGLELNRAGLRRELALAACFARPSGEVEASLVDRILSSRFRRTHPDEVRGIERLLRARPASRLALLKHALAGALHDARGDLGRIRAPTLVLAGQDDALLGTEAPRALSDGISRSTFEIVADSGHDLALEQPLVTGTRVSQFFLS
jgi:pimeloyl-ACP methyl ester carboxylesterase